MGNIVTRHRADGTKVFKAEVLVKRAGKVLHRESKTFSRMALARAWLAKREQELEEQAAKGKLQLRQATLGELIDMYLKAFTNDRTGRSKLNDMRRIQRYPLASKLVSQITSQDLIEHIIARRKTVCRATASNDLVWIHAAYKIARPAFSINANLDAVVDAQSICYKQGLTGKSSERERRPTKDEMTRLMEYFNSMPRSNTPYVDLYLFLLFSGRRASEVTRLRWKDFTPDNQGIYIENVKHPTRKWGNHMRLKLTNRAIQIIERQPPGTGDDRIFPFNEKTLSTIFARACKILNIEDLHMHDLRHEATSNQFELGLQIHQVAIVTGHRSWNMLRRYTHLSELGKHDKWEDWEWLP